MFAALFSYEGVVARVRVPLFATQARRLAGGLADRLAGLRGRDGWRDRRHPGGRQRKGKCSEYL